MSVTLGADGNLYGTTADRGINDGYGTIFQATTAGLVTVLHGFVNTDGRAANGLVQSTDGIFYGTTGTGGNGAAGTVFQFETANSSNTLTTLHLFNAGGSGSLGQLLQVPSGTFYGTTSGGGTTGDGTIFACTMAGVVTTAHSFDAATEGSFPTGGLVLDVDGYAYGTTGQGGAMDGSSVEMAGVRPQNFTDDNGGGFFRVPEDFLENQPLEVDLQYRYFYDESYGDDPSGKPVLYLVPKKIPGTLAVPADTSSSVFYGTTTAGGDNNYGTIYSITPTGRTPSSTSSAIRPGMGSIQWRASSSGMTATSTARPLTAG